MAELQQLLQQNGIFRSEVMRTFLTTGDVSSEEQLSSNNNTNDNQNTNENIQTQLRPATGTTGAEPGGNTTDTISQNVSNLNFIPEMTSANFPEPDSNANEIDVDRILEEVKQVPTTLRQQLIDHVITTVAEAHLSTVTPTVQKVAEANERIAKMKLDRKLPDLSKLSIDPNQMWQKFVCNMVFEITQAIKFCKLLPGFGDIAEGDQIMLIKKGSFEILLCRMCLLVDHVHQEMFDPNMEMKCPRQVIKEMPMGMFIDEFFNVAEQLNPLKLTDEELGIFSASLIMSPNREGLQNMLAIEKLNKLFLQSLYYQMRKHHCDFENKFARLLGVIPSFISVNKKHAMALNSLKMQKAPPIEDFPELHKEIYDIKD